MNLKKTLVLTLLACIASLSYGQVTPPTADAPDPSKLRQQIPTSPEASSLGKFGDIPIGLYTGVPNINIPLYTLKIGDFELPISLSYNSSGIKVEELATNTGLGWTLNAGGTISSSVNGFNDYLVNGYATPVNYLLPPYILNPGNLAYDSNQNDGGDVYKFAKEVADGTIDTQPDLFYYSIPGASGKFYTDQRRQIHPIPFSAIKISRPAGSSVFTITDEQGRIFYFNETESSSLGNNCGTPIVNGTSYLTKIELPDGNVINLTYSQISYSYETQATASRKNLVPGYVGYETYDCSNYPNHTINMDGRRLSGITSTNGHNVQFIYHNNRTDLPGTQSLDSLIIRNPNKVINSYVFNYGYFNSGGGGADSYRLKLLSITDQKGAKHAFTYNETIPVQPRLSFAQDHWGYYNGKNNNTLLPKEPDYGFFDGADREVDSSLSQMCILKQITYPTGGNTRFNYEQNDYYFDGQEKIYTPYSYNVFGRDNQNATTTFSIPTGTNVLRAIVSFNDGSTPPSGPGHGEEPADPTTQISISGDNGFFQTFYNGLTPDNTKSIPLTPGNYTISVNASAVANGAYCKLDLLTSGSVHVVKNKLIGGLRIQSIVNQASVSSNQEVKQYVYRQESYPDRSSGSVNFFPLYTSTSYRFLYNRVNDGENPAAACNMKYNHPNYVNYWKQTANSVYPLGSIKGGSVAYTFVTTLYGSNGVNGKTESTFTFVNNSGGSLTEPLVPFIDNDWQNGILLKEVQYRNQGGSYQPLTKTQNFNSIQPESVFWNSHYDPSTFQSNDYLRGRGLAIQYKRDERICSLTLYPAEFYVNDFRYKSEWLRSDSSRTTTYYYDKNNNLRDSLTSFRQLTYNNPAHLLANIITTKTSKKTLDESINKYPQDYSRGTSAAIDTLVDRHRISTLLQQQKNNNSSVLITNVTYRNWSTTITEPEYVQSQVGNNVLENRIQYYGYDTDANVKSVSKFSGPPMSYLWSYNGQYPIAEIKNSDYSVIESLLGAANISTFKAKPNPSQSEINTFLAPLKNSAQLKDVQITIYTYDPLVGMTSSTDPKGETTYYEYDNFQRLMNVKDKDGNIIKSMIYHYSGQ